MSFLSLLNSYKNKRLLIGGHRGHLSSVRENTIPNFEEARLSGVKYIEIDVQLSRDGQAVIFHDLELSQHTPLKGRTRQYDVEQLKAAFDLCTLREAIAWCKDKDMMVMLEIKSREIEDHADRPLMARRVTEALAEFDFFDACIVFSIDHRLLKMIKQLRPETMIALIIPHVPHDPVGLMKEMDALIYLSYLDNLSAPLVEELHQAGFLVDGSVTNTKSQLIQAVSLGVDMIESDHPQEMMTLYRGMTAEEKEA